MAQAAGNDQACHCFIHPLLLKVSIQIFTQLEQKESILRWNSELDELLYIDLIHRTDECLCKDSRTTKENSKISKQIFIKVKHNSIALRIFEAGQQCTDKVFCYAFATCVHSSPFQSTYSSTHVGHSLNVTFIWNLLSHILFQHFLNCIQVNQVFYDTLTNSLKTQPRIYSQNCRYYFPQRFTIHICTLNIPRNFVIKISIQLNLTQHFP